MIRRHALQDGLVVFRSTLLDARGVPHAFTTRHGGGPSPRLDTGRLDDGAVASLRRAARVDDRAEVVFLHQVHGALVYDASSQAAPDSNFNPWLAPRYANVGH